MYIQPQNSEDMLEEAQHQKNKELDAEYRRNCCNLCGNHLQYVRTYPATCGVCKTKLMADTLPVHSNGNYRLGDDFREDELARARNNPGY